MSDDPFGTPTSGDDESFDVELPEEEGFRIPAGPYPAKVISLDRKIAKSSGNPMWVWWFTITRGKYAGRDFPLNTVLTPAAMWKLTETLKGLGLGKGGDKVSFKKSEAIGKQCIIHIEDDEYQGVERSSIARVDEWSEELAAIQGKEDATKDDDVPF